ncbi:MAG: pyridoxal-5'-phosphate-dependent protein subunit beta, partial [Halobacteria archaeon]|nr:pyridoxal-5'-phosphate-dependent protein subunit beta [Halobacteria archaeon]
DTETFESVLRVGGKEGDLLAGTSSGANVVAAIEVARSLDDPSDATVVTMFCDRGDKYKNSLWREYFENDE